jgi:membrane protease YdiL (CAAX protease family)
VAVATVAFALATIAMATRAPRPGSTAGLLAAITFFTLIPGGYIALSVQGVRQALRATMVGWRATSRLIAGPALLFVVTIGYSWVAGLSLGFRVWDYAAYLLMPTLLLAVPAGTGRRAPIVPVRELAVVLALWLPIEFRLLPALPLPPPNGPDMRKLVGLVDAMCVFLIARPLSRIGYTYRLTGRDATTAVVAFVVYAAVALPIGFATGFIAWHPRLDVAHVAGAPLLIYLVTGVPEEFLFRGLLQNLLSRWLGARPGWVTASVVFGFAHFPDPRYLLLAAIAGLAYGWVYQRTQRVTASAITHALVDGTWAALLGG